MTEIKLANEEKYGLNPSTKENSTLIRCRACYPEDAYLEYNCRYCNGTGWVRGVDKDA